MVEGFLGGLSNAASGVGDFFMGGGKYADPRNINPTYGVPEADVRQAGLNTLGNIGGILLGAGQSMTGAQRGQLLAQLGPALGGMGTDIYKSSQARLMNAQQQAKMREMEQEQGLSAWAQSPENLAKVGMTPENFKILGLPGLRAVIQAQASRDPRQAQADQMAASQRQQAITAIEGLGLSEQEKQIALANPTEFIKSRINQRDQKTFSAPEVVTLPDGRTTLVQRSSTGQITNIGGQAPLMPPQETEEAKALGKETAARQKILVDTAATAPNQISKYNLLERIVDDIGTGRFADTKANIVSAAKGLGLSDKTISSISGLDPRTAQAREVFDSITAELTVSKIGPGGFPANNFSNADLQFITKIDPIFTDDPEANKVKIEIGRRMAKRAVEKAEAWRVAQREARSSGKRASYSDFELDYQDDLEKKSGTGNDLFGDLLPRITAIGQRASAPSGGTPAATTPSGRARVLRVIE